MSQSSNWCFTLNNYSPLELSHLQSLIDDDNVVYLVFQEETGSEGTPHIQGYIQFASRKRIAGAKAIIGNRPHLEVARGTPGQNKEYCTKEDTRSGGPYEYGTMRSRGTRSDIQKLVTFSRSAEITDEILFEEFADVYAKYPRFCDRLRKAAFERNVNPAPLTPRAGWQSELVEYLTAPADQRKIRWICDPNGNTGKSYFATHYSDQRTYCITGGRYADIFYGYNYEPVVFFDLARCRQESCPYEVMESFKNGYFLSTKYEVKRVKFNVPHVIVFSNFEPDRTQLSEDRWDIHHLRFL